MKPFFAGVTGLCIALVFANSAKAQDKDPHRESHYAKLNEACIVSVLYDLAERDDWGRARTIKQNCACRVNRVRQGLAVGVCNPSIDFLSHEQVRKYFN